MSDRPYKRWNQRNIAFASKVFRLWQKSSAKIEIGLGPHITLLHCFFVCVILKMSRNEQSSSSSCRHHCLQFAAEFNSKFIQYTLILTADTAAASHYCYCGIVCTQSTS